MTTPNDHAGHPAPAPAADLFPPAEWAELHEADRQAGRNIVGLLTGVFIIGLIGYTCVCLWVSS